MTHVIGAIITIALMVLLPIAIVWLCVRAKINQDNIRKEVMLAAIEKNSDINLDKYFKKMEGSNKLQKEKLLQKLLAGCIFGLVGLALLISAIYSGCAGGYPKGLIFSLYVSGAVMIAVGAAFFINYAVGKKLLAKELELEAIESDKQ